MNGRHSRRFSVLCYFVCDDRERRNILGYLRYIVLRSLIRVLFTVSNILIITFSCLMLDNSGPSVFCAAAAAAVVRNIAIFTQVQDSNFSCHILTISRNFHTKHALLFTLPTTTIKKKRSAVAVWPSIYHQVYATRNITFLCSIIGMYECASVVHMSYVGRLN